MPFSAWTATLSLTQLNLFLAASKHLLQWSPSKSRTLTFLPRSTCLMIRCAPTGAGLSNGGNISLCLRRERFYSKAVAMQQKVVVIDSKQLTGLGMSFLHRTSSSWDRSRPLETWSSLLNTFSRSPFRLFVPSVSRVGQVNCAARIQEVSRWAIMGHNSLLDCRSSWRR